MLASFDTQRFPQIHKVFLMLYMAGKEATIFDTLLVPTIGNAHAISGVNRCYILGRFHNRRVWAPWIDLS